MSTMDRRKFFRLSAAVALIPAAGFLLARAQKCEAALLELHAATGIPVPPGFYEIRRNVLVERGQRLAINHSHLTLFGDARLIFANGASGELRNNYFRTNA